MRPVRDHVRLLELRLQRNSKKEYGRYSFTDLLSQVKGVYPHVSFDPVDDNHYKSACYWCDEHLGKSNWYSYGFGFFFTTKEQRTWFQMTWIGSYEED